MSNRIREVWAGQSDDELEGLRIAIERYPVVSMVSVDRAELSTLVTAYVESDIPNTEFPGIVARPIGTFKTGSDYHFQTMRCNVDLLKLIQLGITVADEQGEMPEVCCWQFNFRFSLSEDMYAQDSIELLQKSGIDFRRLEHDGIDPDVFAELLITSGLVLFDNIKWVSFHSGYDFGYLLKLLTASPLPAHESEFFSILHVWFPHVYDIKHIMRSVRNLKGGLQEISDSMGVPRIGPQHQAGSDSLLTAAAFFRMKKNFFDDTLDDDYYKNFLYGFAAAQSRVRPAPGEAPGLGPLASSTSGNPYLDRAERERERNGGDTGIPSGSIAAVAFGGDGGGRPY